MSIEQKERWVLKDPKLHSTKETHTPYKRFSPTSNLVGKLKNKQKSPTTKMGSRKRQPLQKREKNRMEKDTQVKESQPNTGQVGWQYSPWPCLLSKYCWPNGEMGEVEWVIGVSQLNPRNTFLPPSQTRLAHMQWSQQMANWEMHQLLWGKRLLQNFAQLCQKSPKGKHTSSLVCKDINWILEQVEKAPASSKWSCCCSKQLFSPQSSETSTFLRLFQLQN